MGNFKGYFDVAKIYFKHSEGQKNVEAPSNIPRNAHYVVCLKQNKKYLPFAKSAEHW
jgi:hypothetical protein